MLETIMSWVSKSIAELLDFIVVAFFESLSLDLSEFARAFPIIGISYKIFQAIGLGLVVAIAVFQLMKYFTGQLAEIKETPVQILIRTVIAVALIWYGGYFLSMIVDLAKAPYDVFIGLNVSDIESFAVGSTIIDDPAGYLALNMALLGTGTIVLFGLIMLILIAINIFKLMIQAAERFLMVGMLTYTSPLIFPTVSSKSTSSIFQKWLGMYVGQCLLMTLTIWSLKMILNGFANLADSGLMGFVLILALCKISQRIDSYMQQLGIGVGTTGGNLFGEVLGAAAVLRRGSGVRRKEASGTVLGADGNKKNMSNFSGLFGSISNAAQQGIKTYKEGGTASDVSKAFTKGAKDGFTTGFFTTSKVANGVNDIHEARKEAVTEKAAEKAKEGAAAFERRAERYRDASRDGVYSEDIQKKAAAVGQSAQQYAKNMYDAAGPGGMKKNTKGKAELDKTAANAGLTWNNTPKPGGKANRIKGPDQVVGEHMAANYKAAKDTSEYQDALVETAKNGSQLAAEEALMNPARRLSENDQLGAALMDNAFGQGYEDVYGQPDADGKYGDMADFQAALTATSNGIESSTGSRAANIEAKTDKNGGRTVTCDYETATGDTYKVETMDSAAYSMLPDQAKSRMQEIRAKSGERYYTNSQKVEIVDGPGAGAKSSHGNGGSGGGTQPSYSRSPSNSANTPPSHYQSGSKKLNTGNTDSGHGRSRKKPK